MTSTQTQHPRLATPWAPIGRPATAIILTLVAGLAACSATPPQLPAVPAAAPPTAYAGEQRAVATGAMTAADVAGGHTAFGVDVLHALCEDRPGENVLVSPTSAALALGLLQPAAAGPAARELGELLHLPAWSRDLLAATRDYTGALQALHREGDLEADDAPDSLRISNRVWTSAGHQPDQGYLDDVATAFDAGVEAVDFAGDPVGATDAINRGVSQDTAGIIEALFDQPLDPSTVTVLTNAVHLKARWRTPFTSSDPGLFRTPSGEVTAEMMTGGAGTARTSDGWTAVELPYRDGTLMAVAVLPPAGTDPCAVDAPTLTLLSSAQPREVGVSMPRLDLEQTHGLLPVLERLGLPTHGDYSALCGACFISEVTQKTVLTMDEHGTEAAAATGVVMEVSAAPGPTETVTVDRPYLLLLTDTATRSPLFMTVVNDPTS